MALTVGLSARGWEVHALVRPTSSLTRLAGHLSSDRIHPLGVDPGPIAGLVGRIRPAAVFHLAAAGRIVHGSADIAPMIEANITLAVAIAEAAASAASVLLAAGSYWEYGEAGSGMPNSLYAATKHAIDPVLAYYGHRRDLRWMKLVLHDIYGPDDWRRRLVTLMVEAAESGAPIELTEGLQEIEPLHVDDAAGAFIHAAAALLDDEARGPIVGIGGGERVTLRALSALIEEAAGRRIDARWGRRPYPDGQIFRPAALPPLASWRPQNTLRGGLGAVVERLRSAQRGARQNM